MNVDPFDFGCLSYICLWLILGAFGMPSLMALMPRGPARQAAGVGAILCFLFYAPLARLLFLAALCLLELPQLAAFLLASVLTPTSFVGLACASFRLVQRLSREGARHRKPPSSCL